MYIFVDFLVHCEIFTSLCFTQASFDHKKVAFEYLKKAFSSLLSNTEVDANAIKKLHEDAHEDVTIPESVTFSDPKDKAELVKTKARFDAEFCTLPLQSVFLVVDYFSISRYYLIFHSYRGEDAQRSVRCHRLCGS